MGFNTSLGLAGSYDLTTPSPVVSNNNYIDFTATATAGWAQQYLPEVYEQEVERYGNRRLGGFLKMVGAEMPMESDQVVWSEQNRLHIAVKSSGAAGSTTSVQTHGTGGIISIGTALTNPFRVGNTVIVTDASTGLKTLKCYVSTTSGTAGGGDTTDITVLPYTQSTLLGDDGSAVVFSDNEQVNIFVYGSEFAKGSASMGDGTNSGTGLKADFQQYSNKPIIIKDHFKISGSDTAQIGWVETTGEDGSVGYSWYLKSAGETRMRFEDYLETAMVEAVEVTYTASTVDDTIGGTDDDLAGSEGLFDAIETRGNIFEDLASLADFDLLLKNLDKQGAIEENMLYVNRSLALTIDDMVAGLNSNYQGGASFGVFNNEADMALNLGFTGFRRGSYDFYKSDWKYLNDAAGRGGFGDVSGVLIPAGTSSVYDESLGKNMKRPFLHVRYRKSATDDRRLKSWVTGSVGSASYSGTDTMEVHYLSERCLITQGANNFVMLKES
ncbi:MAG: hypothetical protein H8E55_11535 [Pelagibacterales bacterium]|nr:hypothetical protein [Pelagibacterales bacterium]